LAEERPEPGQQSEEFGAPALTEGRVPTGEVEFVGGGELGEVLAQEGTWGVHPPGEPVPEARFQEVGVGRPAVAARVEVHDRLGVRADHGGEFRTPVEREQAGGEAVGAVEGVAESGELEDGASVPEGELDADAFEVGEEGAAGVGSAVGTEPP
jgi:hypothetical protein